MVGIFENWRWGIAWKAHRNSAERITYKPIQTKVVTHCMVAKHVVFGNWPRWGRFALLCTHGFRPVSAHADATPTVGWHGEVPLSGSCGRQFSFATTATWTTAEILVQDIFVFNGNDYCHCLDTWLRHDTTFKTVFDVRRRGMCFAVLALELPWWANEADPFEHEAKIITYELQFIVDFPIQISIYGKKISANHVWLAEGRTNFWFHWYLVFGTIPKWKASWLTVRISPCKVHVKASARHGVGRVLWWSSEDIEIQVPMDPCVSGMKLNSWFFKWRFRFWFTHTHMDICKTWISTVS